MWQKIKDRYYCLTNGQRYLCWFALISLMALLVILWFFILSVLPTPVTGFLVLVGFIALLAIIPFFAFNDEEDW